MPKSKTKPHPIHVLFVTPEVYPLIKTGGLGEVSGALPAALAREEVDVRVLLPGYASVLAQFSETKFIASLTGLAPFPNVRLLEATLPGGVPLMLVDCPSLYGRGGGPYQDVAARLDRQCPTLRPAVESRRDARG